MSEDLPPPPQKKTEIKTGLTPEQKILTTGKQTDETSNIGRRTSPSYPAIQPLPLEEDSDEIKPIYWPNQTFNGRDWKIFHP